MIVIIAGGRDYKLDLKGLGWLNLFNNQFQVQGVVSGGASGADREGERWAYHQHIPVKVFKADWNQHGSAAGPIRNKQMADFIAQYPRRAVLLFPGGRGTASMRNIAKTVGLEVYEFPSLTPIP
jgi:hypothetical protein